VVFRNREAPDHDGCAAVPRARSRALTHNCAGLVVCNKFAANVDVKKADFYFQEPGNNRGTS
jgi:hypothetical protein